MVDWSLVGDATEPRGSEAGIESGEENEKGREIGRSALRVEGGTAFIRRVPLFRDPSGRDVAACA